MYLRRADHVECAWGDQWARGFTQNYSGCADFHRLLELASIGEVEEFRGGRGGEEGGSWHAP